MADEDNKLLNPHCRHYFEQTGLETGYRLRGLETTSLDGSIFFTKRVLSTSKWRTRSLMITFSSREQHFPTYKLLVG